MRNRKNLISNIYASSSDNQTIIPNDPWLIVIGMLDVNDLLKFSQVCKYFYLLTNDEGHWTRMIALRNNQPQPLSNKCMFFGINDNLLEIIRDANHPVVKFVQQGKECLSEDDRNFIRLVSCRNLTFTREQRKALYRYLRNNPHLLTPEFICIPMMKEYLYRITRLSSFLHPLELTFSQHNLHDRADQMGANTHLQSLLLCCLLMQVDEPCYGKNLTRHFISEQYDFTNRAYRYNIIDNPVSCTQDLYELTRKFILIRNSEINPILISQFYNNYISFLAKDSENNDEIIHGLVEEKLLFMSTQASKFERSL